MATMTKREFLNTVITANLSDEMDEFAQAQLAKLDAINEKRRNTISKKAQENLPLIKKIESEILTDEPMTATIVGEALGVSTQKASALLRKAVEEGKASKTDVKVKGKGTQKGYTRV